MVRGTGLLCFAAMEEAVFTCPHCWQENHALVDTSAGAQRLIQDCEVCCNPIEITFSVRGGAIIELDVQPAQ